MTLALGAKFGLMLIRRQFLDAQGGGKWLGSNQLDDGA